MPKSSKLDTRLARIKAVCGKLPEAEAIATGYMGEHTTFRIRRKPFAHYVVNEHNDGRIAICCKVAPGVQQALVSSDPSRYYLPKYMAHHGWVCFDLDAAKIDWREIEGLLRESYRLIAPKRLAAQVG